MANYEEQVQTTIERTSAAMYAFWSAMLTAHTVLLSVAVALPAVVSATTHWQFKLVGVLATVCMLFLLFNFASVRMQYEAIGQRLINHETVLTDIQKRRDISKAETRRSLMRVAELLSAAGLVIEALLLAGVLLW